MAFEKDLFKHLKETRTVLTGVARMTEFNSELGEDVLILEHDSIKAYIPRSEMGLRPVKHSLIHYVGSTVEFLITEVNEDGQFLVASIKEVKMIQRSQFIDQASKNEEAIYSGVVERIVNYGAYLSINGVSVLLTNKDFSNDFTTVGDIHKAGDVISVRVLKVKESKITVEAVEKYQVESSISFEDFKPNQIVYGSIRTLKTDKAYVCIAPNLDALCPIPLYFEVKEGDKVRFKVNQVREDGRIRGKIVTVLNQPEA